MSDLPPLISVIIPAYNGERTILRTLLSIVRQIYRPLQLIVVDDTSKDSTGSLVEDFMKKNCSLDEFKLLRHNKNLGLSRSLNDGILDARGDFILILHQDCELIRDDWIEKALAIMEDERVAVVTGYYGIHDVEDESFVKRAFGILRKQFHSCPKVTCEEVTFSEGKCDLYRRSLLLKIEGFPTNYRIAGEDLMVSYKLRKLGYKIVKCYDLPVVQRFSGTAESFWGNMKKEFLFGKAMGGVFSEFKFYLFKGVRVSRYSGSRSLHRASQPVFVLALIGFAVSIFLFAWWFVYFLFGLLLVRYLYYVFRVFAELKVYMNRVSYPLMELVTMALIGILSDFAYSLGFGYGLIRYSLGKRL